jgi:hypothetical protein
LETAGRFLALALIESERVDVNLPVEFYSRLLTTVDSSMVNEGFMIMKRAFNQVIPPEILSGFTPQDLQNFIYGKPIVDIDDYVNRLDFDGYTAQDLQIEWFIKVLHELTEEQRRGFVRLLFKKTRLVPPGGFGAVHAKYKIVRKEYSEGILPSGTQRGRILDLPAYPSIEEMRNGILHAIEFDKDIAQISLDNYDNLIQESLFNNRLYEIQLYDFMQKMKLRDGYSQESIQIQWLLDTLAQFSQEQWRDFLRFVHDELQSYFDKTAIYGVFRIHRQAYHPGILPSLNNGGGLLLPEYPTLDELKAGLLTAIESVIDKCNM